MALNSYTCTAFRMGVVPSWVNILSLIISEDMGFEAIESQPQNSELGRLS